MQVVPEVSYFASKVLLGKEGIDKVLSLGSINDFESDNLGKMLSELKGSIEKGIKFAQ